MISLSSTPSCSVSDLGAQGFEQLADRPFEQLEREVAGEAVGDDDVGRAPQEVPALSVSLEVDARRVAEQLVGLDRHLVALLGLLADREQADGRVRAAEDLLGEDRAHRRELNEVLGPAVGVRAGVDQHRDARAERDRDSDRGSEDARETSEVEQAGGEHRARVAGRDDSVRAAVGHGADGRDEARVRLRPHGLRGLVRHLDPVGRLDERQAAGREPGRAEEHDLDSLGRRLERARDDLVRGAVTAQRVDRDFGQLLPGEAERLDLATLVRAAGRADAVRLLG